MFPDWTHTNAILYSKDDGNLLVSMRHQSWVVKVDYNNGAGARQTSYGVSDIKEISQLVGGTDPTDWFYGQHEPQFHQPRTQRGNLQADLDGQWRFPHLSSPA